MCTRTGMDSSRFFGRSASKSRSGGVRGTPPRAPRPLLMESHFVHSVAARCAVPARVAFSVLEDGQRLGEWALGCWGATEVEERLVRGCSLLDGVETYVRLVPHEQTLSVDYEVGSSPDRLVRRITARAVPGTQVELDTEQSLVVLTAWRPATMDDARWHQLVAAHTAEIFVLRRCVEEEGERK